MESLIQNQEDEFDRQFRENEQTARDVDDQLDRLDDNIVDLNEMVCDKRGDPCDSRCGGAGCGQCGGLTCGEGAVTRANNAMEFAKDADDIISSKLEEAKALRNDVSCQAIWWNKLMCYTDFGRFYVVKYITRTVWMPATVPHLLQHSNYKDKIQGDLLLRVEIS